MPSHEGTIFVDPNMERAVQHRGALGAVVTSGVEDIGGVSFARF
jgi:hypothetical protein